jgi:DNA-binding response OmpR family regulator/transcriptional regulator with XRE-family HTH domain
LATILLVDNDTTLLTTLSAQLEQAGFAVSKIGDVTHARKLFADQPFDLIVLEVRTDDEAGWQLLSELAPAVPVIVVSALSREEDVVRGFELGAIDYIAKPYRSDELIARIRVRLSSHTAADTVRAAGAIISTAASRSLALPTAEVAPLPAPPARRERRGRDDQEEAVFMSEAEEMAMLRAVRVEPVSSPADVQSQALPLGARLRQERQRRHLTLVQIENDLKIRMSYLQAMEDEKFTLLPRGPVTEQMLRSYVNYLGLDLAPLLEEFRRHHYIEAVEPLPALGGTALQRSLPRWLLVLAAFLLALAVSVGAIYYFDPTGLQNGLQTIQAYVDRLIALVRGG